MDDTEKTYRKRREFLRVSTSIAIDVIHLTRYGTIPDGIWVKGEMPVIGGGGARIETPADMTVGDVVCIKFKLPDIEEEMKLYARVVGLVGTTKPRAACIKFVGLSEGERGKIIRFLFRQQIRDAREMTEQGSGSGGEKGERQGGN